MNAPTPDATIQLWSEWTAGNWGCQLTKSQFSYWQIGIDHSPNAMRCTEPEWGFYRTRRSVPGHGLSFCLAHNTVRGAAGAAILNAEYLVSKGTYHEGTAQIFIVMGLIGCAPEQTAYWQMGAGYRWNGLNHRLVFASIRDG